MNTSEARDVQTMLGYLLDVTPVTPTAHAEASGAAYRLAACAHTCLECGGPTPIQVSAWFDGLILPLVVVVEPDTCPECDEPVDECSCPEADAWCPCCGTRDLYREPCDCPYTCPACLGESGDQAQAYEAEEAQA